MKYSQKKTIVTTNTKKYTNNNPKRVDIFLETIKLLNHINLIGKIKMKKIQNYKGFEYSRMWWSRKKRGKGRRGNSLGSMCYLIDTSKTKYINEHPIRIGHQSIHVECLYCKFDLVGDLKETVDTFIEKHPDIYQEFLDQQEVNK